MNAESQKYCALCKDELFRGFDKYKEFRYKREDSDEPGIVSIGIIYLCDHCHSIVDKFNSEVNEFDEY